MLINKAFITFLLLRKYLYFYGKTYSKFYKSITLAARVKEINQYNIINIRLRFGFTSLKFNTSKLKIDAR